jgi:hypothetical protein
VHRLHRPHMESHRLHEWHDTAQALDEVQVQGHRPDVGIYNTVLEVLTRSGVLSAQLKAAQLFQAATRQGQLRCLAWLSLCSTWNIRALGVF